MFKKVLLIAVVSFVALVFLAVAVAGVAATAGLAAAGVAISESGVVDAFEEVADGADRLQIELDDNSVTFTNLDSGESRTVTSNESYGRRRLQFDLPGVVVRNSRGETVVSSQGLLAEGEVRLPEITITDPDSGQSRVISPDTVYTDEIRGPRVVWDGQWNGPLTGLRMFGEFISGLFTLTVLALVALVAYVVLRNRRREQDKLEAVKGEDNS